MSAVQVTIIGMGPRGLSILQRIADLPGTVPMDVHLVDPGDAGQGAHSARQPSNMLTNTVASQITMFAEGRGPSFTEWAHEVGYRRFGDVHLPTGDGPGEVIGEHDYLPRNMLGEYLSWVFDRTVRSLPKHVKVVHHRDRAVDMAPIDRGRLAVILAEGFEIPSDFVFLATGHCERRPTAADLEFTDFVREHAHRNHNLVYCANPYPVDKLVRVAPGSTVAVQGLGLTAHDVIAALTVGRGGSYERVGAEVRYHPSGREPRILLFSRQCLPFSARGVNQKGLTGQVKASFFTKAAVQRLRAERGRLDFETDVLPLLLKEMGYAYRTAAEGRHIPSAAYEFGPEDRKAIEGILDPLREATFANQDEFDRYFLEYVREDLRHAELGNLTSPVKAATDVIRDTRAALREAVESSGLTPESHRVFNAKYVPLMNRVSFGPPRRRNTELLALIEAGVLGLAGGPGCRVETDEDEARFAIRTDFLDGTETRPVDALVIARLDLFHPEHDSSPLVGNLLDRGLIRPFRNGEFTPGGIDTDGAHPITSAGAVLSNVWAVGYPVEGPRYYTYALPRPRLGSAFLDDADACVRDLFAQINQLEERGDHVDSGRQPASVS